MSTPFDGNSFKRDLSDEELTELIDHGERIAASMREMVASFGDRIGSLRSSNKPASELTKERRSAIVGSLSVVRGSLTDLQASLKAISGSVGQTVEDLRRSPI